MAVKETGKGFYTLDTATDSIPGEAHVLAITISAGGTPGVTTLTAEDVTGSAAEIISFTPAANSLTTIPFGGGGAKLTNLTLSAVGTTGDVTVYLV